MTQGQLSAKSVKQTLVIILNPASMEGAHIQQSFDCLPFNSCIKQWYLRNYIWQAIQIWWTWSSHAEDLLPWRGHTSSNFWLPFNLWGSWEFIYSDCITGALNVHFALAISNKLWIIDIFIQRNQLCEYFSMEILFYISPLAKSSKYRHICSTMLFVVCLFESY